ncbi:MAG: hypothetical protein ACRD21_06475 [Vicinamibacteria bacterium]
MAFPETKPRYETRDVDVRAVFRAAAALVALALLMMGITWIVYRQFLERSPGDGVLADDFERPPLRGPRIEISPASELERERAREEELLESYGWVDRERGVVRVPIDQAMEKLLESGLPVRRSENDAEGVSR